MCYGNEKFPWVIKFKDTEHQRLIISRCLCVFSTDECLFWMKNKFLTSYFNINILVYFFLKVWKKRKSPIYQDLITYLSRYPTCLYPDPDRHIRTGKKSNKVNNCRAILVISIRITVSVTSVRENVHSAPFYPDARVILHVI